MKARCLKGVSTTIFLIIIAISASAQKAFETVNYTLRNGSTFITVELADGYFPATKITIKDRRGAENFYPVSGQPDEKGQCRFEPKSKSSAKRYVIATFGDLETEARPPKVPLVLVDGKGRREVVTLMID